MEQTCYILGSLAPLGDNLFSFELLCHTLKKEGAQKVIGIIPYLSYTRHENNEELKSQATDLIGKLLAASRLDELVTLDIHNPRANHLFPFAVHSLSTAGLLAEEIKSLQWHESAIVAPDEGAVERCREVANLLSRPDNLVLMKKTRGVSAIVHEELTAPVKRQAVIIDDILDTGSTLLSCCASLLNKGTENIIVMVTHGLFTGKKWRQLFDMGVSKIYCTDSWPLQNATARDKRIAIIPTASLLAGRIGTHHGKTHPHR